jgi:hypothetical protein
MTFDLVAVVLCLCIAAGGFLAAAPRLLLRWYLREARRLEIPPDPAEAIATYPFV